MEYKERKKAVLLLEDGTIFHGFSSGKLGYATGELCFNTGMTGYQEVFTDPSYYGQLMITTNAHIGNYGIKDTDVESDSIKIAGLICKNLNLKFSRKSGDGNLNDYFIDNSKVIITDVDTRAVVRHIRDNNISGCRIINMSSVSGLFGNFGQVNYGAAKEGIAGFTRSLALEVAKYKCTVNTISPGAATRLTIDLIEAAGRKYDENDWTQGPGQIAPVVAWLCTEEASQITSQIIHSQGGILGIMQQPAIIQSFTTDNLWTLDQLDQLIPELVESKKFHDQEVEEKGAPKKV